MHIGPSRFITSSCCSSLIQRDAPILNRWHTIHVYKAATVTRTLSNTRNPIQQVFWQMRCIFISPKGAAIQKFYRYDIRHGFLVLLNALVTVAAFCTCVACHLPRIAASCRMRDFCQMRHVKCNLIAKGDQPLRHIYQTSYKGQLERQDDIVKRDGPTRTSNSLKIAIKP